ncbi:ABC transporter permease [Paraflavitalea pollutisoli]|uniref:ABC transporter permease n=1 Tax=Paraflavitalea pollutisoli TaxID=3034143 RepID=UPI0023EC25B1|nr:ABC transporter permease [Paraflavitalea sp. H1-2-19X]
MIRNYLKIACRNLVRNKVFAFINVFGLGLSMAVCLLVIIHVKDQLGYDTFHPRSDRMVRIITHVTGREGNTYTWASTPLPLAPKLNAEFDPAALQVRVYPYNNNATSGVKDFYLQQAFVDSGFFQLFGFPLQAGNAATVLSAPNSIVLSQATATKFFEPGQAMGQTISITGLGDFTVTGVMQPPPGKSHLLKDAYLSMSSVNVLEKTGKLPAMLQQWDLTKAYTYLQLPPHRSASQLDKSLQSVSRELLQQSNKIGQESFYFEVQPFDKIILSEEMGFSLGDTGSRGKVWAEISVAFVILLSACFNYTNLSIARSLRRGKEVGVRKVAGARRVQIFTQFIVESLLTAFLALALGYVMLHLITGQPFSREITSADELSLDAATAGWFVLFALFAGLLAGGLPAWALSSFKPVAVLKNLTTVKLFLGNGVRKGLLVIQFALSLIAIIFTLTFYRQFSYMASADPGFRKDHIITLPATPESQPRLKQALEQLNGITGVATVSTVPGKNATGTTKVQTQAGKDYIGMDYYYADPEIFSVMQLNFLAGRPFIAINDSLMGERQVVINERALQPLQLGTPQEAVGKTILLDDSITVQIAGVVKNVFHRGMASPYIPLVIRNKPFATHFVVASTVNTLPPGYLARVEAVWKNHYPGQPFAGSWMQDEWDGRHAATGTVGMLGFLTLITVTIASLGLLGMVIYTTETRRKEIGIRKVMGAGVGAVMALLSRNFVKLLLIAGSIALPIGFLLGHFFLNIFANRIQVGIDILLISFGAMLLIALMTIITQIYRVATANPVNSLRTE